MASSVYFKFRNDKEPSMITFDGTSITVFDLKRDIIQARALGDGTDFDLILSNEDTKEEYDDDTIMIPRATSVIARRAPASKPGHGKAARYVSGKMPVNPRNNTRNEPSSTSRPATQLPAAAGKEPQTEEERIAAMFQNSASQWEQQKQQMASAKPVRPGFKPKSTDVPEHPPPVGYVCYRCGEPGHWIQVCPHNGNPEYDNKPRIKRTTGIPRSFLKTVEKPTALANDGFTDDTKQPAGVMLNAEGEYVIAEPDKASWEKYQAKTKVSQAQQEAAAKGSQELRDRGLECPLDMRMFVDPKKTPCCGHTYCNDCIENALLDSDFVCPNCSNTGVLLDDLVTDDDMAKRIREYEEEKAKSKREEEAAKSPKADSTNAIKNNSETTRAKSKSPSPTQSTKSKSGSPARSDSKSETDGIVSKKRPAEDELENNRIPSAPAAMRKQQEEQKVAQDAALKAQDPTQQFIQQMKALETTIQNGPPQAMPVNNMGFPNQMSMMGMGMGMGMNPGMGMGMGMGNGMGMGMGMNPGMMGMPNPMMNPMMMQNGNWGNMGGMNGGYTNGMYNNYQNQGRAANGYGHNQQNWQGHQQPPSGPQGWNQQGNGAQNGQMAGNQGGFPNQQRTWFSEPFPNEEDNAYFRKPVNPHRHQSRQRRTQRPSDFKEL